jgi:hypothetical protein
MIEERHPDQSYVDNKTTGTKTTTPKKDVLDSSPDEDGFCTLEERVHCHSCLFRRGDNINKGHNPKNLSKVQVPVKMFSVTCNPMMVEHR